MASRVVLKAPRPRLRGMGGGCSPPRGCFSSVSPPLDNSFETFPQSGGVGLGGFVVSRSDLTPNGVVRLQSTAPSVLKVPKDLYPVLGLSREGLRELWLEGEVYDVIRPLLKVNFLIAPFFLSSESLRVPRFSGYSLEPVSLDSLSLSADLFQNLNRDCFCRPRDGS